MILFNSNLKSHELANNVIIEDFGTQNVQTNETDASVIFRGGLYLYRIGVSDTSDNKGLSSWLTYVLYAGLVKFKFKKTRFKINIGLNLRDYYQNIQHYLSVKRQKKINYINGDKEISKIFDIVGIEIYPNIYASAIAVAQFVSSEKFIVLKFGKEDFEGIYFDPSLKKEKQTYILGEGLYDHISSLSYVGPKKVTDFIENKINLGEDAKLKKQVNLYFNNHIARKINRIASTDSNSSIVIVFEDNISPYMQNVIASNIKVGRIIEIITQSNALASEGLYLIEEFATLDMYNEKVGVAISNEKTNFTSRKNSVIQDTMP